MVIKIPKSRIRQIINEELDKALGVDEAVFTRGAGTGYTPKHLRFYGSSGRQQGPALGTSEEEIECDPVKVSRTQDGLSSEIREVFNKINARLSTFIEEDIDPGISISWTTYEPYDGESDFSLINAVDPTGCPASVEFRLEPGTSGMKLYEILLKLDTLVNELEGVSVKLPLGVSRPEDIISVAPENSHVILSGADPVAYHEIWTAAQASEPASGEIASGELETSEPEGEDVGAVVGPGE